MRALHNVRVAACFLILTTVAAMQVVAADRKPQVASPSIEAAKVGMDASVLARIPERMRKSIAEKQIAGAVTLVARRGQVVHLDAVGHADMENARLMTADSIFAIASMTKPITATAVMILQDEGKLSVDDPVAKYLPEFRNVSLADGPPAQPITIRHLMTHTSGIGGSQRAEQSLQATVELLAKQPLRFEPGSKWQYSPGLTVCGRIIEVVSGQSYDEFLKHRIFTPLKMVDTSFTPKPADRNRLALLYKPGADNRSIELASHWLAEDAGQRAPNPSGGLFSTASDMAKFYQMTLNGGELDGRRIVSETAVKQMTQLQTGDLTSGFTPGNGWGLGWCVVREPQGVSGMLSPGTYGHGGAFGTQGWVDPHRQMIFVLMIQRTGFGNSDASDIRKEFQEIAVKSRCKSGS